MKRSKIVSDDDDQKLEPTRKLSKFEELFGSSHHNEPTLSQINSCTSEDESHFFDETSIMNPTTSLSNNNLESHQYNSRIEFIQSMFPSIDSFKAHEVLQKMSKNQSNDDTDESQILDHILTEMTEQDSDIDHDVQRVQSVLQDCDPDYILDKLKLKSNARRVELVIEQLVEEKSYPKMNNYLYKKRLQEEVKSQMNASFDVVEFIKSVPDPIAHFHNTQKEVTDSYKHQCQIELFNRFNFIAKESILKVLESHSFKLLPSWRQLENAVLNKEKTLVERASLNTRKHLTKKNLTLEEAKHQGIGTIPKVKFSKNKIFYKLEHFSRDKQDHLKILDADFFRELQYAKNQQQIDKFIQENKKKFQLAKQNNHLQECTCCFDDQVLFENMISCPVGHLYCKECLKRYAETNISDSKFEFKCLDGSCQTEFTISTLNMALEKNVVKKLEQNIQNEQILKAKLNNLESCPHCTYAVIMENPFEKIFKCLNTDCMRESCRSCKEPNHLPLRCDEIEQTNEIKMRTWIENKITQAMVRECHECGKRFFKLDGCNMMQCPCGAQMCYVCRQAIPKCVGYKHFQLGLCKQDTDVHLLHKQETEKAYIEANKIYLSEHPEMINVLLKNDPKKFF